MMKVAIVLNKYFSLVKVLYHRVVLERGWSEIDEWLANMSQSDTKAKLVETVRVFKSH
jgi:hypothetical protein